jgi:lysophospholipase L1-like esterase
VLSYSGFRIDQMFQKLQPTVRNYNTVVLHIGANDCSRGLPVKTVLNKYQQLTSAIWDINPTVDIILSRLLPRASNQFPGALPRTDFLQDLNQSAHLLNNYLASLASRIPLLHYVGHPSFVKKGTTQRHLLSKDGLHLSFRGTSTVVNDIESARQ